MGAADETVARRAGNFFLGGIAAVCATVFTHPIDVVKTRLQLQGELVESLAPKSSLHYRGVFHAFYVIGRNEGARGLYKGVSPAFAYGLVMNGTRLGSFAVFSSMLGTGTAQASSQRRGHTSTFLLNLGAGCASGLLGAMIGSPFQLLKVQMQAASRLAQVGVQHSHSNMVSSLHAIYARDGLRGLWAGWTAAGLRVSMGSAVQLSTYSSIKRALLDTGFFSEGLTCHFAASMCTGFVTAVAMNPLDVASTRVYNQDRANALYSGPIDCLLKTGRAEGLRGLYKGFWAQYGRLGPHTILTLMFWERLQGFFLNRHV